jgi:DNA-binding NarL/FixJ family response regulator
MSEPATTPHPARRVLVLDARETVQCGVRFVLLRHGVARRCLEAGSLPTAVELIHRYQPHVAIIGDVPGTSQAHAIGVLRRARPAVAIVALAMSGLALPPVDARLPGTAPIRDLILAVARLGGQQSPDQSTSADLSRRQRQVLSGLAAGMTNTEIASALGVSPDTVKWHLAALFRRLGVRNRAQAVAKGHVWQRGSAKAVS